MATEELVVKVSVDDNTKGAFAGLRSSLAGIGRMAAGLATGAAVAGVGALAAGLKISVDAAIEAEQVQAQLNATLKSTGGVAGVTATEINQLATSLSRMSAYDDEAIVSAESLLLTFTNITRDIFPQTIQAVLDLSQAMGQDLQTSAVQVGKALNDPVAGVTALQRIGVRFTEDQKKVIESLVQTGRAADAQRLILRELNTEFGGSAAAAGQTYAGQMAQLKTELGNVAESIGTSLLPMMRDLVSELNKFAQAGNFQAAIEQMKAGFQQVVSVMQALVGTVQIVGDTFIAVFQNAGQRIAVGLTRDIARALQQIYQLVGDDRMATKFGMIAGTAAIAFQNAVGDTGRLVSEAGAQIDALWARANATIIATATNARVAGIIIRDSAAAAYSQGAMDEQYIVKPWQRATPQIVQLATEGARQVGDAYKSAFDEIAGYAADKLSQAQGQVSSLMPPGFQSGGDMFKPGGNGPFENIFRALDVAVRGSDSEWAAKLGLDQETAKSIVAKFQAGLIDDQVKALINMPQLVEQAKLAGLAEKMKTAFSTEISRAAGVAPTIVQSMLGYGGAAGAGGIQVGTAAATTAVTSLVGDVKSAISSKEIATSLTAIGFDLMSGIADGIKTNAALVVDGLRVNLIDPIIAMFDNATAAVNRLRDAINGIPTGGGTSGGNTSGGGATSNGMSPFGVARARGAI